MTITHIHFPAHTGASVWGRVATAVTRVVHSAVEEWLMRRAIRELSGLDDRMLRDIGIKRSEIESRVRWARQRGPYY
jgi:uncharacterized protein YjiS (DUF1127 family)